MRNLYWFLAGASLLLPLGDSLSRAQKEDVKHSSGRPMPALPPIKAPVMFNTPSQAAASRTRGS